MGWCQMDWLTFLKETSKSSAGDTVFCPMGVLPYGCSARSCPAGEELEFGGTELFQREPDL